MSIILKNTVFWDVTQCSLVEIYYDHQSVEMRGKISSLKHQIYLLFNIVPFYHLINFKI
jgi:hypothetical protein